MLRRTSNRNWLLAVVLLCGLSGCSGIPKAELQSYVRSFDAARNAAEEYMLTGKALVRQVAEHPENQMGARQREEVRDQRLRDLDARLAALAVIAEYNDTLVALAEGKNAATIEAGLRGFLDALSQFQFLASSTASFMPYIAPISIALEVIENLIRQRQFVEAVNKGQPIVQDLLRILRADVQAIVDIDEQVTEFDRDRLRTAFEDAMFGYEALANSVTIDFTTDAGKEVEAARDAINALAAGAMRPAANAAIPMIALDATNGGPEVDPGVSAMLRQLQREAESAAAAHEQVGRVLSAKLDAGRAVEGLFDTTAAALRAVREGIPAAGRQSAMQLMSQVLAFRQAMIEARTARR